MAVLMTIIWLFLSNSTRPTTSFPYFWVLYLPLILCAISNLFLPLSIYFPPTSPPTLHQWPTPFSLLLLRSLRPGPIICSNYPSVSYAFSNNLSAPLLFSLPFRILLNSQVLSWPPSLNLSSFLLPLKPHHQLRNFLSSYYSLQFDSSKT